MVIAPGFFVLRCFLNVFLMWSLKSKTANEMLCLLLLMVCFSVSNSARILGIFPFPGVSHQAVFNAYVQELVKHRHDLVVVTPRPTQSKDNVVQNLTEIDISNLNMVFDVKSNPTHNLAQRGVVRDADTLLGANLYEDLAVYIAEIFKHPQVKSIIADKNQHFDLIVLEALMNYHLISGKIFNAPVILVSSLYGSAESFEIMGAVSRHPILYPNLMRSKFKDLTTWETIKECYNEYKIMKKIQDVEEFENALLRQNFGPEVPSLHQLKDNVAMLFLNSHPVFADNRPVPPGVVFLGALHLKPVNKLPEDLKTYLDNSIRGVVYVSFGSNVRPELMDVDLLEAFLDGFEELPYDVMWKYDGNLEKMPNNLKIQKWFPQRDLLAHPNVKVFVTQGGMQSTDEAIDAGVPLVGIPMAGDQWFNTNKYVQLDIGVQLDILYLTAKDLSSAITTVINDRRFKDNIKRLKEIINDQPQRPLELAVWWTEYVLRHGGARHLRSPAANMSWTEYLMVDIFIPVLLVLLCSLILIFLLMYVSIRSILYRFTKKSKVKRN